MKKIFKTFKFGIITDTHIRSPEGDQSSPYPVNKKANDRARYAVQLLADQNPDFVIHLGDMVHPLPHMAAYSLAAKEAKKIFSPLMPNMKFVPGNHDIGDKPSLVSPAGPADKDSLTGYKESFGEDYYSFEFNDIQFIVMNSSLVNIESKIDDKNSKLNKLDLLDSIKEDIAKINENLSSVDMSSRQGHNLPNIDQLLARIDELENKLNNQQSSDGSMPQDNEMNDKLEEITKSVQKLNLSSGTIQKRFERVEETLGRFEDMEKDIQIEYVDDKENEDTPEEKNKKTLLYGLLVILILMVCGAVILDRLNIVDFYLDELFRTFFN